MAAERDLKIESFSTQLETLKAVAAERDRETELFLNSRSWRYTRPLRALKGVLIGRGIVGGPRS